MIEDPHCTKNLLIKWTKTASWALQSILESYILYDIIDVIKSRHLFIGRSTKCMFTNKDKHVRYLSEIFQSMIPQAGCFRPLSAGNPTTLSTREAEKMPLYLVFSKKNSAPSAPENQLHTPIFAFYCCYKKHFFRKLYK